jgi:hypothetical protein
MASLKYSVGYFEIPGHGSEYSSLVGTVISQPLTDVYSHPHTLSTLAIKLPAMDHAVICYFRCRMGPGNVRS